MMPLIEELYNKLLVQKGVISEKKSSKGVLKVETNQTVFTIPPLSHSEVKKPNVVEQSEVIKPNVVDECEQSNLSKESDLIERRLPQFDLEKLEQQISSESKKEGRGVDILFSTTEDQVEEDVGLMSMNLRKRSNDEEMLKKKKKTKKTKQVKGQTKLPNVIKKQVEKIKQSQSGKQVQ